MSAAKSLRSFLLGFSPIAQPIRHVAQQRIPESYDPANGFIWFGITGTVNNRTLDPVELDGDSLPVNTDPPDELIFDLEIYHKDLGVLETVVNLLHRHDTYGGSFGDGTVGVMFVEDQRDDYVRQITLDEDADLEFSSLRIELRLYKEA